MRETSGIADVNIDKHEEIMAKIQEIKAKRKKRRKASEAPTESSVHKFHFHVVNGSNRIVSVFWRLGRLPTQNFICVLLLINPVQCSANSVAVLIEETILIST